MELRIHPASHDAELRVFSPRTYTIIISCHFTYMYVRLWGERFRRHNNSSKRQQSQPNNFAVAVVVVALGRWLHVLSQSSPTLLAQLLLQLFLAISNRIYQLHLLESSPVSRLLREAASIELSVYISLKTSGIRTAVYKKGNDPSSATYKGHNSKDTGQRTRCTFVS